MNKKKIIIAVIALLLIGVILYFVFRTKAVPTDTNLTGIPVVPSSDGKTMVPSFTPESFPLDLGMQGDNVRHLQWSLNRLNKGSEAVKEDGIFGNDTKKKLLLTVPISQSQLPMSKSTLNAIMAKANLVK